VTKGVPGNGHPPLGDDSPQPHKCGPACPLGWFGLDGLEESTDRTAADEMHHFEAVSLLELGFTPSISRDDVAIQFHCHAISLHAQDFYERAKGEWSSRARELPFFPIDL
jgi:hypothetical protein